MNAAQNPAAAAPPHQAEPTRNRQFLFIIMLYVMLSLVTHLTPNSQNYHQIIKKIMATQNTQQIPYRLFSVFRNAQFEGKWHSQPQVNSTSKYLQAKEGRFYISFGEQRISEKDTTMFEISVQMYNGEYSDTGKGHFNFYLNDSDLQFSKHYNQVTNFTQFSMKLKEHAMTLVPYQFNTLLYYLTRQYAKVYNLQLNFTSDKNGKAGISMSFQNGPPMNQTQLEEYLKQKQLIESSPNKQTQNSTENQSNNTSGDHQNTSNSQIQNNPSIETTADQKQSKKDQKAIVQSSLQFNPSKDVGYALSFTVYNEYSRLIPLLSFAIVMGIVAYAQFSSLTQINKQIFDGQRLAEHFSLIVWFVAMMWDTVLCFASFSQAFSSSQEGIVLFIMPSFIFALVFMNLEPRIMILIYRSHVGDMDLRQLLCKFNIYNYTAFVMIYPILMFANFSTWLFLSVSLMFLPQIYANGIYGQRPDICEPYYRKFLLSRFLVIFYIRGFPLNIYDMQPDYLLCVTCAILVAFQMSILWIQRAYGPKSVIPNFLLPPIYNYGCEEEFNIEQAGDVVKNTLSQNTCSICLIPLSQNTGQNSELGYEVNHRIMKTPCGHKYHGICLVRWMKIKMECPQCRTKLPPYE